jgi:hypothetical protein
MHQQVEYFNNCTLCPHCIDVFCICLRTNSDLCHLQHELIGFYNRDKTCLQRGTDWAFKRSSLRSVFQNLISQYIGTQYSPTRFGTLKCHHQGVQHYPAEIDAKCRGKQRRMGAVYCKRRRDGLDMPTITGIYLSRIMFDSLMTAFRVPKLVEY